MQSQKKEAVIFIGNAGAGKSTLLSQLGGGFKSGAVFRKGFTTERQETEITFDDKKIILMDVPGLFEPNNTATESNSKKLTDALKQKYRFKVFFILKATNSGPTDDDLVMMSKVNESLCQGPNEESVSFRVIVNQIMDDKVKMMYKEKLAHDNFKSFFESVEMEGYSFDIKVDKVTLLRFDEAELGGDRIKQVLSDEIRAQKAVKLKLKKSIQLNNSFVAIFKALRRGGQRLFLFERGQSFSSSPSSTTQLMKPDSESMEGVVDQSVPNKTESSPEETGDSSLKSTTENINATVAESGSTLEAKSFNHNAAESDAKEE